MITAFPTGRQAVRWLLAAALGLTLGAVLPCSVNSATAAAGGTVTTVAGSGLSGNADGPSQVATFMFPFGIAVAGDGTIYVSDMAGQRIRAIKDGAVTTIAGGGEVIANGGWVHGAYRDGAGSEAKFDKPAGLALLPDQTLLVADSNNHCIRAIRGNLVTTYAGNPRNPGTTDGPLKDATFSFPRSLAVDRSGNVYVADLASGVRKISRSGVVSTVAVPKDANKSVVSVAVAGDEQQGRLYASDHDGLVVADTATGAARKYAETAQGSRKLGYPDALLALDDDAIIFSDARAHTVRLLHLMPNPQAPPLSQPLSVQHLGDAANNGGGFRDGLLETATFDSPRGIARATDGTLLVADSGNRRIRRITGVDVRLPASPSAAVPPANQVWFAGGSMLFFDTLWTNSIPGIVEQRTSRSGIGALQYDDSSAEGIRHGLEAIARARPSMLIWLLTTKELSLLGPDGLLAALRSASAGGEQILACVVPFADELTSSSDYVGLAFDPGADRNSSRERFASLRQLVARAGTRALDVSGALKRYDAANAKGAAYATVSPYPTDVGRALIAGEIATEMLRTGTR